MYAPKHVSVDGPSVSSAAPSAGACPLVPAVQPAHTRAAAGKANANTQQRRMRLSLVDCVPVHPATAVSTAAPNATAIVLSPTD